PQNVTALCATGTPDCDPAPEDRCDEGGNAPGDASALAATRSAVAASCPCAAYDGTHGHTHTEYLHCVRRTLAAIVAAGQLRGRCRHPSELALVKSTCGRPEKVVCCESQPSTRCLIVSPAACIATDRQIRSLCAPATECDATTCLSAGVCAAGG